MTFSMSTASLPVFEIGLAALSGVLAKGEAFAAAKKIDPSVLLSYRLAPDMFALPRQVQIACDTAKGAAGRLAGIEAPKHEDNEKTFEELRGRIAKCVADEVDAQDRQHEDRAREHDEPPLAGDHRTLRVREQRTPARAVGRVDAVAEERQRRRLRSEDQQVDA